ncbi:MAG: SDR family oxidoreductase [Myxococcales bacterium]|nr:SDR family oxidoreductase [Myxococcales bacterium]MCB9543705.1 SDR family oxidoreductase [Myxococcales bacterium]MCB9551364.1 SDR family oxidoreductase [Myxococcales bacterium]
MTSPLHLITGATGLVGSAIALELLATDPDARVVGLVRPDARGADERLRATLTRAARLNGHGDRLDAAIATRATGVAADIEAPDCGVAPDPTWAGAALWHCAAALDFHDRYRDAVMRTNVDGTRHVIALARAAGVASLDYVSTAYVAGTHDGIIPEAPIEPERPVNNHYERSKIITEALARDAGLPTRILRPSIVVGHSETCGALTLSGVYGFQRGVFKFARLLERTQAELSERLAIHMHVAERAELDLIPIDTVARHAVALSRRGAPPGIYHLAGLHRVSTRGTLEVIFRSVGLPAPVFVDDPEALSWLDRKLDAAVEVYGGYLRDAKHFARDRVDAALDGPDPTVRPLDLDAVARLCAWAYAHDLAPRAPLAVTA